MIILNIQTPGQLGQLVGQVGQVKSVVTSHLHVLSHCPAIFREKAISPENKYRRAYYLLPNLMPDFYAKCGGLNTPGTRFSPQSAHFHSESNKMGHSNNHRWPGVHFFSKMDRVK
jgi:hypothetical protein